MNIHPFLKYLAAAQKCCKQIQFSPQVESADTYCINTQPDGFSPASAGTSQGAGDREANVSRKRCTTPLQTLSWRHQWWMAPLSGNGAWPAQLARGLACCIPQQAGRTLPALNKPAELLLPGTCSSKASSPHKRKCNSPIKVCNALLHGDPNWRPTQEGLWTQVYVHWGPQTLPANPYLLQNTTASFVGLWLGTSLLSLAARERLTGLLLHADPSLAASKWSLSLVQQKGGSAKNFRLILNFPVPTLLILTKSWHNATGTKEVTKGFLVCFTSDKILLVSSAFSFLINTTHVLLFIWKIRGAFAGSMSEIFSKKPQFTAILRVNL